MTVDVILDNKEFMDSLKPKDKNVVQKALELWQDYKDLKEANRVSQAIKDGSMKTHNLADVKQRLGIE